MGEEEEEEEEEEEFTIQSSLSGVNTSADNVYAELTINARQRRGEGECSLLVCKVYLA